MYSCFLCMKKYNTIATLIWHMKIYHNLGTQSFYMCKQQSCCRDFRGLKSFRQHLNREHNTVQTCTTDNNLLLNSDNNYHNDNLINDSELNIFSFQKLNTKSNHVDSYEIQESIKIIEELVKIDNPATPSLLTLSYNDIIKKCALTFISKLMIKPSVTNILLQEVIDGAIELFSSEIVSKLKSKVMPLLDSCSPLIKYEIHEMFNALQNPFADLTTEHHRMKYLILNDLFIEPKTVVVGYTKEKKNILGEDRLLMVPIQGHFLSLKKNLKSFFELPGIYNIAVKYMNDSLSNIDTLISFLDGSTWKQMRCQFSDKIVFPLFLYYDDIELGNPLGSHSGIHKMGCIYYTVAALPPEYLSALENIFVAFLFHSADQGVNNKVSNDVMFSSLIQELIDLQENGITIHIGSVDKTIYFALGLILGDNLGLNSILGYVESFNANYCCRICRCPKHDLRKMLHEPLNLIRNENNYETDVNLNSVSNSGINERCVFNKVPNFHVVQNMVCDFMHDIPEGVARYDMALVIKHLIDQKYFTLNELNSKIVLFDYGVTERQNCPPVISQVHLNNGVIIMSASEMLCLIRNFGLIVGEVVPKYSLDWKLYILLRKIVDLCCARRIQSDCAILLDSLVAEHNRLYLILSQSTLKPKYHILTHYGRMLLKNGPIKLTSCIRFEAKHKVLKAVANAIPCRINIGHTLANKLQLQTVSRLLSKTGVHEDLKLGIGKEIFVNSEFPALLLHNFPHELNPVCYNASWLKFKGVYYKKGILMILNYNLDGCNFGEVVSILVGKSRIPYFVLNPICSIGFDSHYHAYEIEMNNSKEINHLNLVGYYINELPDSTPTSARVLGNGKMYATLKYAL